MPRLLPLLSIGLALALSVAAAPVLPAQDVIAIVRGEIIDGNGGAPIADGVVLVRGERIVAVGPATSVPVPPGARVIDARGKAVLPGLADLHVHLVGGWDGERADLLGYQRYLNALLYAGVTTILDTGNNLLFIQQLRQEVAAGRFLAQPSTWPGHWWTGRIRPGHRFPSPSPPPHRSPAMSGNSSGPGSTW